MGSDVGNTTVAQPSQPARSGVDLPDLALVWLFPRPGEPAVRFDWSHQDELVMGRDETCAVRLLGNDVSRRHAALRKTQAPASAGAGNVAGAEVGGGVEIHDLGSRNGIRVNGRQVATAKLSRGDVVRVGGWVGVVTAMPGELREVAPGLLGGGVLQAALASLRQAAASDLPIVLEGETGTGKEVVARSVHHWSGRSGALVAVNCAALPEALAEGELFGYRRGAFTGADRSSPGLFRSADGGTLLLDEVSDLPMPLQAKLLRALEAREVQPLGEARPVPVDVRVVVAGQQSLAGAVRQGRFRADLFGRLDGVTVRLPPLRDRREDVPPLFSYFLQKIGQGRAPAVEVDFIERLCLHDWPFNVRELVLLVRRLMVLHGGESTWRASHLPERIGELTLRAPAVADTRAHAADSPSAPAPAVGPAIASGPAEPVELPALVAALRASGGNVARAAAMVGITRQRAYRLMEGKAVDLEALRKQDEESQ
jgi:transcriptional regulator with AAA-type ATPase domain